MPGPQQSSVVKVQIAGLVWHTNDGSASAVYMADIIAPDKLPFFAEISLPNPDGSSPEIVRKEIHKGEKYIRAEGKRRYAWKDHETYAYGLRIFSDENDADVIDSVDQESRCIVPNGISPSSGK
jgi:hypothetical protein